MRIKLTALVLFGVFSTCVFAEESVYSKPTRADYPKDVFFGDTHLHSRLSADASSLGNMNLTQADAYLFAQGQAMQLTNILRDIGEDLGQNRVYLPIDILQLHGIETCDNIEIGKHPKLPEVCKFLAHIAEKRYVEARLAMKKCHRSDVRSARMMLEVYYLVLSKLKKQGWINISRRVKLSKREIIMSILRYGIF